MYHSPQHNVVSFSDTLYNKINHMPEGRNYYADTTFTSFCHALPGKEYIKMQQKTSYQPARTQPADQSNGT